MDKEQFNQLMNKLDVVIKLIALDVLKEGSQKEQVAKFVAVGLTASQIADLMGKPLNTITAYVSQIKKGK